MVSPRVEAKHAERGSDCPVCTRLGEIPEPSLLCARHARQLYELDALRAELGLNGADSPILDSRGIFPVGGAD